MIEETLARRFIDGEVLRGEDARAIIRELYDHAAWRIYTVAARAQLREGNAEKALELLDTLLEAHEVVWKSYGKAGTRA